MFLLKTRTERLVEASEEAVLSDAFTVNSVLVSVNVYVCSNFHL